jgi:hypothetical protein
MINLIFFIFIFIFINIEYFIFFNIHNTYNIEIIMQIFLICR